MSVPDSIPPRVTRVPDTIPQRVWPAIKRSGREALLVVLLMLLFFIFSRLSPHFTDGDNLAEMARSLSETGLMAVAQTLIILTGAIDISVGSTLSLSGVALGLTFARAHLSFAESSGVAMGIGALAGLVNGIAVGLLGMPPLVVTLATLAIYRGLAIGISNGESVTGFPDSSSALGQGTVGPFPDQFILLMLVAVLAALVLYRTPFGRRLFAMGYNETASRLGGVPVDRIRVLIFTLSGLAAGIAAVIHVSRVGTARADAGLGMELDVISAVVLGGTDVAGGDGGLIGTMLGLAILAVLRSGLNMINFPPEGQSVIIGGLLIAAIAVDRFLRRRRT